MATKYTVHAFGIVPAANQVAANARIQGMRPADGVPYGPNNFSVPLNADGSSRAATHYGCHWAMTAAQFAQLSTDATLVSLGVVFDATRGRLGEQTGRKAAWLAATGLKERVTSLAQNSR